MDNFLPPKEFIIDSYQQKPRIYRWMALLCTSLFWLLWMILWFPVYTIVLRFLTGQITLNQFFQNETNKMFFANALDYIIFLALFFLVYFIWAQYNLRRYGKMERRQHTGKLTLEEETKKFHIDLERAQEIRANREIFLDEKL